MIDGGVRWLHAVARPRREGRRPDRRSPGRDGEPRLRGPRPRPCSTAPTPATPASCSRGKDKLPRFGTAFLARALALNLGPQHAAVTGLLDDLSRAVETTGTTALVRERPGHDLGWYMSDDVRTTAIATDAFLDLRPDGARAPEAGQGTVRRAPRRPLGDDAGQPVRPRLPRPLRQVARRRQRRVGRGEARRQDGAVGRPRSARRSRIKRDLGAARPRAPAEGAAHDPGDRAARSSTRAVLRFRRDIADQKPYAHGITVRREYLDPETDAPVDPAKGVKVGGMVRVRVTVSPEAWGKHLAVDDPIPAGLEAVNTKLVTSGGAPKKTPRRGRDGGGEDRRPRRAVVAPGRARAARRSRARLHRRAPPGRRRPSTTWRARRRPGRTWSRGVGGGDVSAGDHRADGAGDVRGAGQVMRDAAAPREGSRSARLATALVAAARRLVDRGARRVVPARAPGAARGGVADRARRAGGGAPSGRDRRGWARDLGPARPDLAAPRRRDARLGGSPLLEARRRRSGRHRARASALDLVRGRAAFGGSTLTMQLARLVDPHPRTLWGKLGEAVAAGRIERVLVEARDPRAVPEPRLLRQRRLGRGGGVALLLRQARRRAVARRGGVPRRAAARARGLRSVPALRRGDRGGARTSSARCRRRASSRPAARDVAEKTPLVLPARAPGAARPALRRSTCWPTCRPRSGRARRSQTTLDGPLQQRLEVAVRDHLDSVGGRGISQAGVVVLRNSDGAILAMVGSRDYFDAAHAGAVNVTTILRRPGSTLKPFVYGLALEAGDTPATLAYDVVLPGETPRDLHRRGQAARRRALPRIARRLVQPGRGAHARPGRRAGAGRAPARGRADDAARSANDAVRPRRSRSATPSSACSSTRARSPRSATAGAPWCRAGSRGVRAAGGAAARHRARARPPGVLPRDRVPDLRHPERSRRAPPDVRQRRADGARLPGRAQDRHHARVHRRSRLRHHARVHRRRLGRQLRRQPHRGRDGDAGRGAAGARGVRGARRALRHADRARRARGARAAEVCALSGMRPGPDCPHKHELFIAGTAPRADLQLAPARVRAARGRVAARRWRAGRAYTGWSIPTPRHCPEETPAPIGTELAIVYPADGARFVLESGRPAKQQMPPLRAIPAGAGVRWTVDGVAADAWVPRIGTHVVKAAFGAIEREVGITFE